MAPVPVEARPGSPASFPRRAGPLCSSCRLPAIRSGQWFRRCPGRRPGATERSGNWRPSNGPSCRVKRVAVYGAPIQIGIRIATRHPHDSDSPRRRSRAGHNPRVRHIPLAGLPPERPRLGAALPFARTSGSLKVRTNAAPSRRQDAGKPDMKIRFSGIAILVSPLLSAWPSPCNSPP